MPSTDITYCTRECGNMECKRNKEHIKNDKNDWVFMATFPNCKEWKPDE